MSILILFILIPLLTIIPILASGDSVKAEKAATAGSVLTMALSLVVTLIFFSSGSASGYGEYRFTGDITWFKSMNIHFATGADYLTVMMLLSASASALAGITIPVSDQLRTREFYAAWMTMTAGINGFIVSLDLVMIFIFYMIAVFPLFFLYLARLKENENLVPISHFAVLMGGAAILLIGILGVYTNSAPDGNEMTFNILHIKDYLMPAAAQRVFASMVIAGFGMLGALFPFGILFPAGTFPAPAKVAALFYGITMKLGAYGAFRLVIVLMPEGAGALTNLILILSATGAVYGVVGAFISRDLNKKSAHASVSFSCVIFFMLFFRNETFNIAAVILMIVHSVALPFILKYSIKTRRAV